VARTHCRLLTLHIPGLRGCIAPPPPSNIQAAPLACGLADLAPLPPASTLAPTHTAPHTMPELANEKESTRECGSERTERTTDQDE